MTNSGDRSLDPENWDDVRALGHRMLDDMIDHIADIRDKPVWQPAPEPVRARFNEPLPEGGVALDEAYAEFVQSVLPYSTGNLHPGFMGWVHGGGTAIGMLAEMLAGGLNANLGGRDHMPIVVERQITGWMRELFGFPQSASGLFVTGTSMANFIAILVAKNKLLGEDVRKSGLAGARLRAYTSEACHGCIAKGLDMSGLGSGALRTIATGDDHRIDVVALAQAIQEDRNAGLTPFLVVGSAGTVDTGVIDDLDALADLCAREQLTFHVDGAFGALAAMSPVLAPRLKGIGRADSIAFDFHKWTQVPYDAGFILVRDGDLHRKSFQSPAAYLQRTVDGLAAGSPWPCDFGPDLSRGFRALKTWFTLKTFGTQRLGEVMNRTCEIARHLEKLVLAQPELELLAPASLNIVCFRYRSDDADGLNESIVTSLQTRGIAAPSTTRIAGKLAIRAAIFNHRTRMSDVETLVDQSVAIGRELTAAQSSPAY